MSKISLKTFNKTGFGKTDGDKGLKTTLEGIPTSEEALRTEAEAQYQPTYEIEKQSLSTQLTALIQSQSKDSELLNKNYQQSVNTMMGKLKERGIDTGTLPSSTEAALTQFYNETMSQRQIIYNQQQENIEQKQATLEGNYEQNILARMSTNRLNNLKSATQLLEQIASLQSTAFNNYTSYLLAKKAKHRGGGGGGGSRYYGGYGGYRRYGSRGSGGGSSITPAAPSTPAISSSYFMGNKTGGTKKKAVVIINTKGRVPQKETFKSSKAIQPKERFTVKK